MSTDTLQLITFDSPVFNTVISVLRIVFLVVSALMAAFIIWALLRTTWLRKMYLWDWEEFLTYHPYGVKKLYKQWQKIKLRLDTGIETEYKLAVIDGDSLLEEALKKMGFTGDTLSERLDKLTEATLPNLAEVLQAHQTRNRIVHEPDFRLTLDDAKKAMDIYEKALTDLQLL